jgi:hydroxymethylpyrimidine pyrophosphatase-like HAD family hydrolase
MTGMKKVFASDFDGTLYFYKAEVKLPPENVEKIKEYQAAGGLFGLCTGRQVGGLTPFIGGIIKPDFYITSTGANIVDGDFNDIFRRGIDRDVVDAICKFVNPTDPNEHRISIDINGVINVFAEMDYPGEYHVITGMKDAMPGLVHQLGVHNETFEEAAALAKAINEKFGDYINAFQNVVEVDIAPKGCTKGKGVERLRKFYADKYDGIKLYGIGDSINDMPLLIESDIYYTFPYAPKEVQEAATYVVPTIVDALEHSMKDPV